MIQKILIILCCIKILFTNVFAQDAKILSVQDFIEKVKTYHPLARVANIQIDKAKANLLTAKGGFDPTIDISASSKTFDKKNYYYYNDAALKIPLPVGDVKTGIENNGGQFLDTEISKGRSSYLGVEIPLAKGLLIDKRRAFLQQAKIAVQQNTAQQRVLVNDLLLEAYNSYYQWAGAYKLYTIYNGYVQVSKNRLKLVKTLNANGDRALMDTVETFTQLQNFELLQMEASIKLTSTILEANNFIWNEQRQPQNIASDVVPDTTIFTNAADTKPLIDLLQNSNFQNPLLQQYRFKIDGLKVEKKLKYQNLLPTVNVKGNILNNNYYALKNLGTSLLENNNRWGIDIKIPLRFREGRGEYRLAKLKIEESNLELQQKAQEIENKIKDYYNQFSLLQYQLQIANDALKNYSSLLKNETLRFNNGESSLFLINTRENKMLEIEQKIIEIQVKLLKAKYSLDWSAGLLQ